MRRCVIWRLFPDVSNDRSADSFKLRQSKTSDYSSSIPWPWGWSHYSRPTTQYLIPEDLHLQQPHCGKHSFCKPCRICLLFNTY